MIWNDAVYLYNNDGVMSYQPIRAELKPTRMAGVAGRVLGQHFYILRVAYRINYSPRHGNNSLGFRCVAGEP